MSDAAMKARLEAIESTVKRQGAQLRYLRRLVDGAPALKPSRDELAKYMRDLRERVANGRQEFSQEVKQCP